MAFPPQAFIIGAQRSGTTSLAFLLNQHPMIALAEPKEPNFLTMNWENGIDWYRSCFSREDAILLDASVSYSMAKIVDFHQLSDGFLGLSCVGEQRFRIAGRSRQSDGLNLADVGMLEMEERVAVPGRHARLAELIKSVLPQLGEVYKGVKMRLDDAAWVGHRLAEILPIPATQKQFCLELADPIERLDFLSPLAQEAGSD